MAHAALLDTMPRMLSGADAVYFRTSVLPYFRTSVLLSVRSVVQSGGPSSAVVSTADHHGHHGHETLSTYFRTLVPSSSTPSYSHSRPGISSYVSTTEWFSELAQDHAPKVDFALRYGSTEVRKYGSTFTYVRGCGGTEYEYLRTVPVSLPERKSGRAT